MGGTQGKAASATDGSAADPLHVRKAPLHTDPALLLLLLCAHHPAGVMGAGNLGLATISLLQVGLSNRRAAPGCATPSAAAACRLPLLQRVPTAPPLRPCPSLLLPSLRAGRRLPRQRLDAHATLAARRAVLQRARPATRLCQQSSPGH